MYCTSSLPSLSAVSCPKFSCLQLKSPVMIVLICRVQMVLMISWDGFFGCSKWLRLVLIRLVSG